jgi:hypothetical protein
MHGAALALGDLAKIAAIAEVVRVNQAAGLAVVAALNDALRHARSIESWQAGRERVLEGQPVMLPVCGCPIPRTLPHQRCRKRPL